MKGMKLLCVAALLAVCGSVLAQEASEDAAITRAKTKLLMQLKDPDSAKWFGLQLAPPKKPGGEPSVCGWVNSKNSYGGYVGFQPFSVSAGMVLMWGGENDDMFRYAWQSCGNMLAEKFGDAKVDLDFDIDKRCKKSAERGQSLGGYDGCVKGEADAKTWLAAHPTARSIVTRCERQGRSLLSYSVVESCVDAQEWNLVLARGPGLGQ